MTTELTEGVFTFQFLHRITVMKTAIKFKICRFMYIAIVNTTELEKKTYCQTVNLMLAADCHDIGYGVIYADFAEPFPK